MINPSEPEPDLNSEIARMVGLAKLKTLGKLHDSLRIIPDLAPGMNTALYPFRLSKALILDAFWVKLFSRPCSSEKVAL